MKRKCLALVLSALMLTASFTACDRGTGHDTQTEPDAASTNETEKETEPMTDTETKIVTETPTESVTEPETAPGGEEIRNPEITERYFIYRIWNFEKNSQAEFARIVDAAEAAGFNAIKVHMPWYLIEAKPGTYDYSGFDEMVDYVVNTKGMKAAISIDLSRKYADGYFKENVSMLGADGKPSVGGSPSRIQISFCCEEAMDAAVRCYADAVAHFDTLFGDGILLYLPAFNQYCETEYWAAGEYDYSEWAQDAFRSFLRKEIGGIGILNELLGTSYASFNNVKAPAMNDTGTLGVLWYRFRHAALKSAIDRLADAQKAVCPDTKLAVQLGSVFDGAAKARGTLGIAALCEKVDVLWVDDGPTYDHLWSMDYIRSALPSTVQLAQEIDGPTQVGASPENYLRQGLECFAHGATYVSIANWSINENFNTYKPVWREIADTWLGDNHPEIALMDGNTPTLEISLYDVFRRGSTSFAQGRYTSLAKGGKFVNIKVTDDLTQRHIALPTQTYSYPGQFSNEQGVNNFSYMSYTRRQFVPMTFDTANNRWQGEAAFTLIMPNGTMHPDTADAALVFTCPQDGQISYTFSASPISAESGGVQVAVMQNGVLVFPESTRYQKVSYSSPLSETLTLDVKTGDEIAFLLNPDGAATNDSTAVTVDIEYK